MIIFSSRSSMYIWVKEILYSKKYKKINKKCFCQFWFHGDFYHTHNVVNILVGKQQQQKPHQTTSNGLAMNLIHSLMSCGISCFFNFKYSILFGKSAESNMLISKKRWLKRIILTILTLSKPVMFRGIICFFPFENILSCLAKSNMHISKDG